MQYYHRVWLVLMFGWLSNLTNRISLSPALPSIMKEFSVTYSEAGLLASATLISYSALQIPSGYIGDKVGRKVVLILSTIGWGICSFLAGLTSSFAQLLGLRFLTGFATGAYFGNDRALISASTPVQKLALGQGVSFMGAGLALSLGIFVSGLLVQWYSWRAVFLFFAALGFVASLFIAFLIREPARPRGVAPKRYPRGTLLRNRDLLLLYFTGIPSIYSIWLVATWAPSFLLEIGLKDIATSSLYTSLLGIAAVLGLWVSGIASDRLSVKGKGRKMLMGVQLSIYAVVMVSMAYAVQVKAGAWALSILIFASGFLAYSIWPPMYAMLSEIAPKEILGTAFGLLNAFHFLGSMAAPWVSGWVRDATGSFSGAIYIAAILILAGAFCSFSVRPSFRLGKEVPIARF